MTFDWETEDRYISNGGKGPLTARILFVVNGVATMERTQRRGGPFKVRFSLSVRYLSSPCCGWCLKAVDGEAHVGCCP